MSPSDSERKLRTSAKAYPAGVRWAIDYPPEYLRKLRDTDPAAYEFLLKFIEAEYGCRPELMYDTEEERHRCYNQVNHMREDILTPGKAPGPGGGYLKNNIRVGTDPVPVIDALTTPQNPEDAIAALIDRRHVLSAPWRDKAAPPPPEPAPKKRRRRSIRKKPRRLKSTV